MSQSARLLPKNDPPSPLPHPGKKKKGLESSMYTYHSLPSTRCYNFQWLCFCVVSPISLAMWLSLWQSLHVYYFLLQGRKFGPITKNSRGLKWFTFFLKPQNSPNHYLGNCILGFLSFSEKANLASQLQSLMNNHHGGDLALIFTTALLD